jgi:hypothetical protein
MKLLLDECIVQGFRHLLTGHELCTIGYMGWAGTMEDLAPLAQEVLKALQMLHPRTIVRLGLNTSG